MLTVILLLINQHYSQYILLFYLVLLKEKDLLTIKGRVRQRELFEQFTNYWGVEVLDLLESNIEFDNQFNWLKVLTRDLNRVGHRIRHILLILFLCDDIKEFFNTNIENEENQLYPCLNPISDHYNELIIKDVKITPDYKTRVLVGTFTCKCGFVYSRKMANDKYQIGRIKKYGFIWENKLKELILEDKHSLREISRRMKCYPKTVVYHAKKIRFR